MHANSYANKVGKKNGKKSCIWFCCIGSYNDFVATLHQLNSISGHTSVTLKKFDLLSWMLDDITRKSKVN